MFPLALLAAVASWWALLAAIERGSGLRLLLSALLAALAVQVRPEMGLWPAVLALSVPVSRGWASRLSRPWVPLVALLALTSAWAAFRVLALVHEGMPDFMRLDPAGIARAALSGNDLLASPRWTPVILWALAVAGVPALAARRPRALAPVLGGLVLMGWVGLGVSTGLASAVRLQSTLHPFVAVLAGAGAAWIADHMGPVRRRAAVVLLGILVVAASLARAPRAARLENPQMEYRFLERTVPGLPATCTLVVPDRFMADGIVSTEFPDWWRRGGLPVETSLFLEGGGMRGCAVLYRGLSCRSFTHEEEPGIPPSGIRPECSRIEERYRLVPIAEESFENRPDCYLVVPGERVTVGFYALEPP
jgi:hypothetical protein